MLRQCRRTLFSSLEWAAGTWTWAYGNPANFHPGDIWHPYHGIHMASSPRREVPLVAMAWTSSPVYEVCSSCVAGGSKLSKNSKVAAFL